MTKITAIKKFLKQHKEAVSVALILLLATFFRFYKFSSFQYWSTDDEIFSAVVTRMIFTHKLTLVSPNATLGVSLGSFFHIISIVPYVLSQFNATRILLFGSALGVATTVLMYLTGRELGGKKVGFFTSFLYATSFLVSFTDHRWWPLTPDAFLATLGIFSLIKMSKGRYLYSLPLAIAASFAWHADPTILVISVAAVITFIVLRLPLFHRLYLPALIYIFISVLPFLLFEIRHPRAISHPINHFIVGSHKLAQTDRLGAILRNDLTGNFARSIFLAPTSDLENYLIYCETCKEPPHAALTRIIAIAFMGIPLLLWKKNRASRVPILYIASFIVGTLIFSLVFGTAIYLHFYVIVWPAFFLLSGLSLDLLWRKKWRVIVMVFLIIVLGVNLNMILKSQMKYPLRDKEAAANFAITKTKSKPFSLVVDVDQRRLDGMGGLFYLKNSYPANASYYEGWNWIYMAYSLYGTNVEKGEPSPVVVISPKNSSVSEASDSQVFGDIRVSLIGK